MKTYSQVHILHICIVWLNKANPDVPPCPGHLHELLPIPNVQSYNDVRICSGNLVQQEQYVFVCQQYVPCPKVATERQAHGGKSCCTQGDLFYISFYFLRC